MDKAAKNKAACKAYYQANKADWPRRAEAKYYDSPEYMRKMNIKRLYGMTVEQYSSLLTAQGGVCKICKKPEQAIDKRTKQIRHLAIDHCHVTGKIRGLLCSYCNVGLGFFKDDKLSLQSAIEYLRASECG